MKVRAQVSERFSQLARLGEIVFHVSDLANLWQISNKNTLRTTLKRYTQKKILYRIWRGMYSLKPIYQLDPLLLGIKALHSYAYVSAETILFRCGIISQRPYGVTLISSVSRRFSINNQDYYCRKLSDKYLFNPIGIIEKNGVKEASLERAVADLLYFNPKTSFDAPLDWDKIKKLQKNIGYPLIINRYKKNANNKSR